MLVSADKKHRLANSYYACTMVDYLVWPPSIRSCCSPSLLFPFLSYSVKVQTIHFIRLEHFNAAANQRQRGRGSWQSGVVIVDLINGPWAQWAGVTNIWCSRANQTECFTTDPAYGDRIARYVRYVPRMDTGVWTMEYSVVCGDVALWEWWLVQRS